MEVTVSPATSQTETVTVRFAQPVASQATELLHLGVTTSP